MRLRTKLAALAVTAGVALTASAAFAYWTTSGGGSGSASVGDASAVTVNQTSPISDLYPGGASKALSGTFTNPGHPAHVASVTASVTATGVAGCDADDFVIGGSSLIPDAEVVTGSTWSGLNVSMTDTALNQDACKNASLTITYAAHAS